MTVEAKRGCGYRRVGGLYLVGDALAEPCHRLPLPLHVCPTCSAGIKPSRGWTWVGRALLCGGPDRSDDGLTCTVKVQTRQVARSLTGWPHCERCVLCSPVLADGSLGLLWCDEKFYPTPEDFAEEAARLGVSRRVKAVPHGFEAGKTWVLMAHRKGLAGRECEHRSQDGASPGTWYRPGECPHGCPDNRAPVAGVIAAFRPRAVELVLRESEATPDRVEEERERGVTVVAVPDGDPDHDPEGAARRQVELPC